MVDTTKKAAPAVKATPAKAEGKKRTVLTGKERIAKLEAELAAARKKDEEKAQKQVDKLLDKRSAVDKRVSKLLDERSAIDKQLTALGHNVDDNVTVSTDVDQGTFV